MGSTFYGRWIVLACMVFATVSWSVGAFGMSVYLYALTEGGRFSISTVSIAMTLSYLTSGALMVTVGRIIAKHGPRPVVAFGALVLALAVVALPYCQHVWHVYAAFLGLGLGMACLSTNTIGSTLAPWFERLQGRAMSTAMLGASIGGMLGTPLLMGGIRAWGFHTTTAVAAGVVLAVLLPLAAFVLKRRPQDIGQLPDGMPPTPHNDAPVQAATQWDLRSVMTTRQFRTHVVAFGVAFMVQVGFLSHLVPLAVPQLGAQGAATAVLASAGAAFVGRLVLARYADTVDVRLLASCVLLFAAASLACMALLPGPWALMALSITFGLTVGNVTTLAPLIIRREFGAASFGVVFGLAATLNQLSMAMGPSLYGILRDAFGSYDPVLLLGSSLNIAAAAMLFWGGRRALAASGAA